MSGRGRERSQRPSPRSGRRRSPRTDPMKLWRIICPKGHVTEIAITPRPGLIGHIRPCPICGPSAGGIIARPWSSLRRSRRKA
jgi:hypothetical protein